MGTAGNAIHREPWNKGKIVGQKAPLKLKDIWALRVRLQMEGRVRELALFNLGIDSKLRGCDLVALKVRDVCHGDQVAARAIVLQHKTQRPVQFEIAAATRDALQAWIEHAGLKPEDFLFPSRLHDSPHLGTRQYARILEHWVDELGLDRADYGTHSMRRTKATLIYRRTKNLRAVQLLLGHSKLESKVRYLGIEVDDALEISERQRSEGVDSGRTSRRIGAAALDGGYVAKCRTGGLGHFQSYDRARNRHANDRFLSTAVVGRRLLERTHSPKQSLAMMRRWSAPDASRTSAARSADQPTRRSRPQGDVRSTWMGCRVELFAKLALDASATVDGTLTLALNLGRATFLARSGPRRSAPL